MFSFDGMLFLALKKVPIIKITALQIAIIRYDCPVSSKIFHSPCTIWKTLNSSLACFLLLISNFMQKRNKTNISLGYFQRHWWSKTLATWLDERHNYWHPTKSDSFRCYLHWSLSPFKNSKRSIDSFQKYWWSKNVAIWLVESVLGIKWRT